jgi:crotonobetainyl-CoA:carnitine CoA-transferase CaiB-like acyl-CoA transferase
VNDVFVCRDGEVAITVRDRADDDALRTITSGEELAAWCGAASATDVMERLQGVGVPAGRVQNGDDLTDRDVQLASRNLFGTLKSGTYGERPFDRFPAIWSRSNLEPYRCAPAYLGEHNFEVLTELGGMTEDQIATGMGDGLLT